MKEKKVSAEASDSRFSLGFVSGMLFMLLVCLLALIVINHACMSMGFDAVALFQEHLASIKEAAAQKTQKAVDGFFATLGLYALLVFLGAGILSTILLALISGWQKMVRSLKHTSETNLAKN